MFPENRAHSCTGVMLMSSQRILSDPLTRIVLALGLGSILTYGAYWWALEENMGMMSRATVPAAVGSVLILYSAYLIHYGGAADE